MSYNTNSYKHCLNQLLAETNCLNQLLAGTSDVQEAPGPPIATVVTSLLLSLILILMIIFCCLCVKDPLRRRNNLNQSYAIGTAWSYEPPRLGSYDQPQVGVIHLDERHPHVEDTHRVNSSLQPPLIDSGRLTHREGVGDLIYLEENYPTNWQGPRHELLRQPRRPRQRQPPLSNSTEPPSSTVDSSLQPPPSYQQVAAEPPPSYSNAIVLSTLLAPRRILDWPVSVLLACIRWRKFKQQNKEH